MNCNSNCFGGNCWWIIILLLLFCCCGNNGGCANAANNNCGCPMLGWLFPWKTALCAAILLLCVFCYRAFCRFL